MPLKIFPVSLQIQLHTTSFHQSCGEDAGAAHHQWEQNIKQNPLEGQTVCLFCSYWHTPPLPSHSIRRESVWAKPPCLCLWSSHSWDPAPVSLLIHSCTTPAHPGSQGSGKDRAALNCCPLWAESGMGNLPQHGTTCDGFHWFLLGFLICSQVLVNYWTFLRWLLNREGTLYVQLHRSPELKWNKVRQKTSCDWGFKVVPSDQSLKDTQIFFFLSFNFQLIFYLIHMFSFTQWIPLHTTSWLCEELVLKAEDGEERWVCSCTLLFFLPPSVLFIPSDRNFNIHLWQHHFHGLYAYQCQLSFSKENHLLPGEMICNFIVRVASLK